MTSSQYVVGVDVGGTFTDVFVLDRTTGEGITTPLTYTRERRCVMVEDLRILGR